MLRLIDEGVCVNLSDDLRAKLFMTADDIDAAFVSGGEPGSADAKKDPTFGMTPIQKKRYEKRLLAKPRPRDVFDVQKIIRQKESKLAERAKKLQEKRLRLQQETQTAEMVHKISNEMALLSDFESIPNRVFGDPYQPLIVER